MIKANTTLQKVRIKRQQR